jgi:DNA polymerase III alpha subunit
MTLEDETGFVNLVVWERVFAEHSVIAQTASFMGVTGKLQTQDGVVHVVAENLWIPKLPQRPKARAVATFTERARAPGRVPLARVGARLRKRPGR